MEKEKIINLIDEYLENYIKIYKSDATYETYKCCLGFWKKYTEYLLEQKKLNNFLDDYFLELKIHRVHVACLRSFLKWVHKKHPEINCNSNYVDLPKNRNKIERFKTYKSLDIDEINQIIEVIINTSKPEIGLIFAFFVYFQYYSGLRIAELFWNEIEFMVPKNKYSQYKIIGKGNKERLIFVKDFFIHVNFKEPYNFINKFSEIFPFIQKFKKDEKFKKIWKTSFYKQLIIKAYKKCLKIYNTFPHFSSHSFRYSFANRLSENNVPITAIKTFMGHSNINTTAIYLQQSEKDLEFYYFLTNLDVIKSFDLEVYRNEINLLKKVLYKVIKIVKKYENIDLPIILEETKKEITLEEKK